MAKLKGDSLAVLEYFTSGVFTNTDAVGRTNYYAITSVPRAKFDGRRQVTGGSSGTFNAYHNAYLLELGYRSSCLLDIFVEYDSTTRFLKVKSRVTAVDAFENASLRYAVAESHIDYSWGGGSAPVVDSTHHVARKMLPNYVGVAIPPMNPNDTFIDSQTYTLPIPSGYPPSCCADTDCYVVVFVQDDDAPSLPVFRSAKSGLFETWVYGDANADSIIDQADAVYLINHLFAEGPAPDPVASGDPNYDCIINTADIVYLINHLFAGGPEPERGCAW